MREKVVFFFPWKELSGGPNYLTGLANRLAADGGYDVYYVDYSPGLSDPMLDGRVRRIVFAEPFQMPIQEPVTLITPIYCAPFIPRLHEDARIVFVNWHNFCIQALADTWRLNGRRLQTFLRMVHEHDAVFFLDKTHLMAQNEWIGAGEGYRFRERYVPPVVELSRIRSGPDLVADGEINIGILGRLSEDKTFAIVNLLRQLERAVPDRTVHVHIIGEGDCADRITGHEWGGQICLHMAGTVVGDELRRFLAEKTDVLFAMGMSVLEGASIGLPSVIMPHNVHPFDADRFTYLQETAGYAVGWYDTQIDSLGVPTHTVSEILRDIYADGKKAILGAGAGEYLKNNHVTNIGPIRQAVAASSLTYAQFRRFARGQGRIRVLGVPVARLTASFDGSVKSVSVLGIRDVFQYVKQDEGKKLRFFGRDQDLLLIVKRGDRHLVYIRLPFIHM